MRDYRKISFWNKFWIHFFKIWSGDSIEKSLGYPNKYSSVSIRARALDYSTTQHSKRMEEKKEDGWAYMNIKGKDGSKTLIISGDPIQEDEHK